jgi:hypothetical protein
MRLERDAHQRHERQVWLDIGLDSALHGLTLESRSCGQSAVRGGVAMSAANDKRRGRDVFGLVGMLTGISALIVSLGYLPRSVQTVLDTQKAGAYFRYLAQRDTEHIKRMKDRTLSGTAAADFAVFQYYFSKAREQGGNLQDPVQRVDVGLSAITLCKPGDQSCNKYDNF